MSAALDELRVKIAELGRRDAEHKRFGAAAHRYQLLPPMTADDFAALEAAMGRGLPTELRKMAVEYARGGAGPGYGWIPVDRVRPYALPDGRSAIPVSDYGCGQIAALELDSGAVLLDARGREELTQLNPSFISWYSEWYVRLSQDVWPSELRDNHLCPLPHALSGYLAATEQQLGLAAGTLAGDQLREVLGALGPGAIHIAAVGPPELFDPDDVAAPCLACAALVRSLVADGIRPDVLAPGVRPRPARDA